MVVVQLCEKALYHSGCVGETVDLVEIVEEQRAGRRRAAVQAVEVDLLAAVVRAQPDQVALVGDDVVELVLPEEAAQRGVRLALLLARLDRDREVLPVRELPAHDRVRDQGRPPEREEQVDPVDLRQVEGALLPARREVGLGAVVEVAHVADRDEIAVKLRLRWTCDVGAASRGRFAAGSLSHQPSTTSQASASNVSARRNGRTASSSDHCDDQEAAPEGTGDRSRRRAVEPQRQDRPGQRQGDDDGSESIRSDPHESEENRARAPGRRHGLRGCQSHRTRQSNGGSCRAVVPERQIQPSYRTVAAARLLRRITLGHKGRPAGVSPTAGRPGSFPRTRTPYGGWSVVFFLSPADLPTRNRKCSPTCRRRSWSSCEPPPPSR